MKRLNDQRISLILRHLTAEKVVLDVGCAHHDSARSADPYWLHQHLHRKCPKLIGLELEEDEAQKLCEKGFNVINGDICDPTLSKSFKNKFDVIVAGEVIEHLSNPGIFLENCNAMLNQNGLLIISTPYPWNFFNIFSMIIRGSTPIHEQHTAWYDETVLRQLLQRYGFRVDKVTYLHWMKNQKWKLISYFFKMLRFYKLAAAGLLVEASPISI